ncbi:MAG: GAF domain-containing protein [Armatimonadetes bacterium]|nr:GAF domain-containing protein [Armatimonadota bacterium]
MHGYCLWVESRRNLTLTYAEIAQATTFDETLQKVRAAIVRTGLFDRAGIYYVQGDRCHSAWGTSIQGQEVDEHGAHYSPESYESMMAYLRQAGTNYCTWEAAPEEEVPSTATLPYTHGLTALEVGDDVLGLIFVDNFITNRPIREPAMELLAEFAKQVSVAVKNAQLLEAQSRLSLRQARLSQISSLLSSNRASSNIEQMVTDALVEVDVFDRANCWVWNTVTHCMEKCADSDKQGEGDRERSAIIPLTHLHPKGGLLLFKGEADYVYTANYEEKYAPTASAEFSMVADLNMEGIGEHCVVALRVEGEFVGYIAVDNKHSQKPITEQDITILQTFAQQAAIAIHQARLRAQYIKQQAKQSLFSAVSTGLDDNLPINDLLRLIYDGIRSLEKIDRVGIWVFQPVPEWMPCGWGTSREGVPHAFLKGDLEDVDFVYATIPKTGLAYYYWPDYSSEFLSDPGGAMYGVNEQASIPLYEGNAIVGLIVVDNFITGNPLTLGQVELLLPYANQARVVIQENRKRWQRKRDVERNRWLSDMVTATIQGMPLTEIMAIAYEAIKSYGEFDRVGVFVVNNKYPKVRGVWGTDKDSTRKDISFVKFSLSLGWRLIPADYWETHDYYIYDDYTTAVEIEQGNVMYGVRYHALVLLKAHGQIVGCLDMDNLFGDAPISDSDVEAILPFAEQTALAVYNALLAEDKRRNEAVQQRFEEMAEKINSSAGISDLLLFIREVAMQQGELDRVGIFLVNPKEQRVEGVWGTTREGDLYDMSASLLTFEQAKAARLGAVLFSSKDYILTQNYTAEMGLSPNNSMYGVRNHVAIALRADGEVVGALTGDNLISEAPIDEENIRLLLPFALQAAAMIRNIRLKEEQLVVQRRSVHLERIAANIALNTNLEDILGMVRDAAVEAAGFDRAAVFLYNASRHELQGVWGTDNEGNREDIHHRVFDKRLLTKLGYESVLHNGAEYTLIEDYAEAYSPLVDTPMVGVKQHLRIALRIEGRVVGVLNADNLMSGNPITYNEIKPLIPFANEAAIAIRNAQLLVEREKDLQLQKHLATLATAINATHDLKDILRMFRNALVEVAGFERAAVWLYDGHLQLWQGVWGTQLDGTLDDISTFSITHDEFAEMGLATVAQGLQSYVIAPLLPNLLEETTPPDDEVFIHAGIALRLGETPVGIVTLDNRRSGSPISEESVQRILPFADQVAVAIQNARLLDDQWHYIARQRRLGILVASVSANHSLKETLRLAREAVVEGGEFDRAALFIADTSNDTFYGVWGTDNEGNEIAISEDTFSISNHIPMVESTTYTGMGKYFLVQNYGAVYAVTPDDTMFGVKAHGGVPIEIENELVGCIFVDNAISQRPITDEDMLGLLPFAHQVATAIRNVSLLEERDRYLERQRRLAVLASAINANVDLQEILRIARDAVVSGAGFDRAGIYMVDPITNIAREAWGTDNGGKEYYASEHSFIYTEQIAGSYAKYESEHGHYYLEPDWQGMNALSPGDEMYGVHWHGLVPITLDGKTVALIFVDNLLTDRVITHEDMLGLLPLASQIAVAIRNAELFENLKRAHAALVRSERLSAVGELAGGVAHNVNNILAAVMGYSELIQMSPNLPASVMHYAQVIENAAKDGADIVRRVQQFARKDRESKSEVFDLTDIVQGAVELTRPLWQNVAHWSVKPTLVSTSLEPNVSILGVASEMREVVVNLIRNAIDALPQGGTITLLCQKREGRAVLMITDNGVGMSEEVRMRLFEPFFSTKQIGLGTGLGLSLTWGTVQRHQGTIEVQSEPNKGAEFTLSFPLIENREILEVATEVVAMLPRIRVVLVEDEAMVSSSMEALLEQRGAEVIAFPNAHRALSYLVESADRVEVVISDQGMPGMTGLELLAEVKMRFPSIRRVLISGWGEQIADTLDVSNAERVVSKPVKGNDIVHVLLELLGKRN